MALGTLISAGKRVFKEAGEDDISGLAAELAYRLLLALFPFFIFLAALGGFIASIFSIDNPAGRIVDDLAGALPSDASSVLREQLESILSSKNGALLSLGIVGAIWAASGAMNTVVKALNRAHDVEETRPFWKRYLLTIGLTVFVGIFFISAFVVLIIGQLFAEDIAAEVGVEGIAVTLLNGARLPIVLVLLGLAVAIVYWAAPNVDLPFRWVSPGSVIFIIAFVAFTLGFGFYVANFGSYNETYGALAGVVILLVWLYTTNFILLFGAELNAVIAREAEPEAVREPPPEEQQAKREQREVERERVPAGRAR
jgi:membrane protein